MVYCGKPSKSCLACRERKTRCDKAMPSCSQCVRAKRQCAGYRDELDLRFRNESTSVIGKAKAKEKAKSKAKEMATPPLSSAHEFALPDVMTVTTKMQRPLTEIAFDSSLMPTLNLTPTLEERAGAFFNASYEMRSLGGNLDFYNSDTVGTLFNPANMDDHLIASINAVGLAGLSNSVRSPDLMKKALKDYVVALHLTNTALRSPTEVAKDSTLFSVMILSIFETVAGSTGHSFEAWTEHVNGAAALVKLRGQDQFKTHAGRRMFLQVTSNLMISCMQRIIPMPDYIEQLRKVAEKHVETDNPAWKLSDVIIDCTKFRANVRDGVITGPREVITRALEIDRRFVGIFSDLPDAWQYTTIYTDSHPEVVWNRNYHAYQNCWVAQIWNAMRTCRVLLHELIHFQLKAALSLDTSPFGVQESKSLHRSSTNALIQMRTEILASIPQHTGSSVVERWPERSSYFQGDPQDAQVLQGSRSYFMLWPLYLAGSMDSSTDEIRLWVINRLRSIADELGIRQASVLADFVGRFQHISSWERRTHWKGVSATMMPLMGEEQYPRYPQMDESNLSSSPCLPAVTSSSHHVPLALAPATILL